MLNKERVVLNAQLINNSKFLSIKGRDLFREVMSTSTSNSLIPKGILNGLSINKEGAIDYNLLIEGFRVFNKTGDIGIAYADAGLIELPDNSRAVAAFIVKGPFNDRRSTRLIRDMAAAMAPFIKPKPVGLVSNRKD